MCSKKLRIAAYYLSFLCVVVGEKYEILYDAQQSFLAEQPLHHCQERTDAVGILVGAFHLAPSIEEFVVGEQTAVFVVYSVADDNEDIVSEQVWNVSAVSHRKLGEGIHYGCVLLHCTLEFQHHHWQTVDVNNSIGNAFFRAFDFQLVDNLENILFGIFEINRFYEKVGQRSIFALDGKSFNHKAVNQCILFV